MIDRFLEPDDLPEREDPADRDERLYQSERDAQAVAETRAEHQPEPPRLFLVPTGEIASEGVPVYQAFETLAEARDFGRGIHPIPDAIFEVSITPADAAIQRCRYDQQAGGAA